MIESLFPYAYKIHVTTVFILIALVVLADTLGFLWVLGKKETLDRRMLSRIHNAIWVGLGVMLLAGAIMAYPYFDYLRTLTPFLVKMGFVAALIINSFVIGKHIPITTERPYATLTREEKAPLFLSGAVSTISWAGAIIAATMLDLS